MTLIEREVIQQFPTLKNFVHECFVHGKVDELIDFLFAIEIHGQFEKGN